MAQLTWRDVAAPNLGNPQDSINSAAKLLAVSTGGLSGALTQFGDQQALQQLAQYSDAQKLQADIQSGRFNTANASVEALATIMGRPTSLIADQSNQQMADYRKELNPLLLASQQGQNSAAAQKLIEDQYGHTRKVDTNVATDAVKPLVNSLISKATGQDFSGFAGLSPEAQATLSNGIVSSQRTTVANTKSDTDEANRKTALALLQDIQRNVAGPDGARQRLAAIENPEVAALVQQGMGGNFGNLYGSKADVDPASAVQPADDLTSTIHAGTRKGRQEDVVLGYGEYGLPSKPVSQSTLGELGEFGRKTLIPNTRDNEKLGLKGTGKGSSAVGKYQFTQETAERLAPKVFGKDWEKTVFTLENQDKLAEALFNESKGGNLKAIWQGLPNATAGAYKDVPWSQMKEVIGRVESQVDRPTLSDTITPAMATRLLEKATTDNAFQKVKNDPTGLYKDIEANANNNASAAEVANLVTGPKGILEGEDSGRVLDQINSIVRETGMTPAQAADTIVRNSERNDWTTKIDWFTPGSTTKLGDGRVVRDTRLADDIKRYQNKDTLRAYGANKDIDAGNAAVAAAIQAQAAAEELYKRAKGLQSNAGFKAQLPALEKDVLKKRSKVAELLQSKAAVNTTGSW
jgi:hypothetical protein